MQHARRVPLARVLPVTAILAVGLLPASPAHAGPGGTWPAAVPTAVAPDARSAHPHPSVASAAGDVAPALASAAAARPASSLRMTSRGRSAVRWARHRHYWPTRTCMVFVRTALRVSGRYPTPRVAWSAARYRHRTRFDRIPAGVPVYTAGRTAPGHIVLSLGNGRVRSTDWPRAGRVGTVRLSRLLSSWNHHYLGWSEDLNGVRVWHR